MVLMIENLNENNIQGFLDNLYENLEQGKLSLPDYRNTVDDICSKHRWFHDNFRNRIDNRTLGQYAVDLHESSKEQKEGFEYWFNNYAAKDFNSPVKWHPNGVDGGSGRLILKRQYNRNDFHRSDYRIVLQDGVEVNIEYKSCPSIFKATYKVCDLEGYISQGSYILTVFKHHRQRVFYSLIGPEAADRMLRELRIVPRFEVGHKNAVQLFIDKVIGGSGNFYDYCQKLGV